MCVFLLEIGEHTRTHVLCTYLTALQHVSSTRSARKSLGAGCGWEFCVPRSGRAMTTALKNKTFLGIYWGTWRLGGGRRKDGPVGVVIKNGGCWWKSSLCPFFFQFQIEHLDNTICADQQRDPPHLDGVILFSPHASLVKGVMWWSIEGPLIRSVSNTQTCTHTRRDCGLAGQKGRRLSDWQIGPRRRRRHGRAMMTITFGFVVFICLYSGLFGFACVLWPVATGM